MKRRVEPILIAGLCLTAALLVPAIGVEPPKVHPAPKSVSSKTHAASPDFQFQHGTLAVAVIEARQITIAIDSRLTIEKVGMTNRFRDGAEKVFILSSNLAFFYTGAGVWESPAFTISLPATARSLATEWQEQKRLLQLGDFAAAFKERVATNLARLTLGDIHHLHLGAQRWGNSNVFTAVIAGRDWDASFRLFRVVCSAFVDTNRVPFDARLVFDVAEDKIAGSRSFIFFGASKVFDLGVTDPKSRMGAAFRQIRSSQSLLAEPVAAALLDLGMREFDAQPNSPVGYPIFVYVVDSNGGRLTRKVNKDERIPFDSRRQGE